MRSIRGFVTCRKGQTLEIKLESGLTINWIGSGLRVGMKVLAAYDFTNNKITNVLAAGEEDLPLEPEMPEPVESYEVIECYDSGALEPEVDQYEYQEMDFGI